MTQTRAGGCRRQGHRRNREHTADPVRKDHGDDRISCGQWHDSEDLHQRCQHQRQRSERPEAGVLHDLAAFLGRRTAEGVCRVGQAVLVEGAGDDGTSGDGQNRRERSAQRLPHGPEHRSAQGAHNCSDEREPGDAAPQVAFGRRVRSAGKPGQEGPRITQAHAESPTFRKLTLNPLRFASSRQAPLGEGGDVGDCRCGDLHDRHGDERTRALSQPQIQTHERLQPELV